MDVGEGLTVREQPKVLGSLVAIRNLMADRSSLLASAPSFRSSFAPSLLSSNHHFDMLILQDTGNADRHCSQVLLLGGLCSSDAARRALA